MDQEMNRSEMTPAQEADKENRRDAAKKLGKYAAYAAPFILLASTAKGASQGGSGGGGFRHK